MKTERWFENTNKQQSRVFRHLPRRAARRHDRAGNRKSAEGVGGGSVFFYLSFTCFFYLFLQTEYQSNEVPSRGCSLEPQFA